MDSDSRAAHEICAFGVIYKRFKNHMFSWVLVHTCYTLLYFSAEAAFNNGLNPRVMVAYQHFIGSLVMLPFLPMYLKGTFFYTCACICLLSVILS